MAVLRLLAGEPRTPRSSRPRCRTALQREAGESNPDTALFRSSPDAILEPQRLAAERFLRGDRPTPAAAAPAGATPESAEGPMGEDHSENPSLAGAAFELAEQSETPRQCPYCGETLPGSRKVNFFPVRAAAFGRAALPACRREMDVGWRYCVSCGRATVLE